MNSLEQYLVMKRKIKKLDGLSEKIQKQESFIKKLENIQNGENVKKVELSFKIEKDNYEKESVKLDEQEVFKVMNISRMQFINKFVIPSMVELLKEDLNKNKQLFDEMFYKKDDLDEVTIIENE